MSESDSICHEGEPAIESDAVLPALTPPDSFIHRASSAGVAASHSLAVLSQLAVRIRAPSGLNTTSLTRSWRAKEAINLPETVSQSLAVLSQRAVTTTAPSCLKC